MVMYFRSLSCLSREVYLPGFSIARLDESSWNIFRSVRQYDVVTYIDPSFFQMFLWKRFGPLSPMPVKFKAIKPEKVIVTGSRRRKPLITSFEG